MADLLGVAAVIAAIGTVTSPFFMHYYAQRGRADLRHESNKNLDATEVVLGEVKTINGQTMAQFADAAETRRVEDKPRADRTDMEREHLESSEGVER